MIPTTESNNYKFTCLIFEVMSLASMIMLFIVLKKTIETFERREFDLIRNDFTTDIYKLNRDFINH